MIVKEKRASWYHGGSWGRQPDSASGGSSILWDDVALGWAAAFGVGLILSAPVISFFLMITELGHSQAAHTLGRVGASGIAFLACLYGGYISGNSANRSGLKQGLLVPLLTLGAISGMLLFVVVAGAGLALMGGLISAALDGVSRGSWPGVAGIPVPEPVPPYILSLLFLSFLGGGLGGIWGARRSKA